MWLVPLATLQAAAIALLRHETIQLVKFQTSHP